MGTSDGNRRNAELAKIHLAKKQLQLDEETYRAMLWTVGRVQSARDLDAGGRARVLEHLEARGFRPHRRGRSVPAGERVPLVRKIRAQLMTAKRPDAYADGLARKMFGVDRFEWCQPEQLRKIIAALAKDAGRHGRRVR